MKKTIIALAILLVANTGAFAQDSLHKSGTHQHKMTTLKKYTCSIHPDVVMNKPGKCAKCGMRLEVMKTKKFIKKMGDMKM